MEGVTNETLPIKQKVALSQFNNLNQFKLYFMVSKFGSYGLRLKF